MGTFLVDYTAEVLPSTGQGSCPSGTAEFIYDYDEGIATQQPSGDQLFFSYSFARLCLNQSTGAFTFKGTADYTGGTGAFANASGSFKAKSSGTLNLQDFSGTQSS